jgi:hypothetical protein
MVKPFPHPSNEVKATMLQAGPDFKRDPSVNCLIFAPDYEDKNVEKRQGKHHYPWL